MSLSKGCQFPTFAIQRINYCVSCFDGNSFDKLNLELDWSAELDASELQSKSRFDSLPNSIQY